MVEISVIICSHNPRPDYFRRVLEALRNQTLPKSQWELLLIDNASKVPLVAEWDVSWHPNARHVFESELGLSHARQRGMDEAAADLLVFVDDDNVLDLDYLSEAIRIDHAWPQLGAWGSGSLIPEFDLEPPDHLKEFLHILALKSIKAPCWSNVSTCRESRPCGAGFCVRASVATAYCRIARQSLIQISGRSGNSLLSGEDVEICLVACSLGMGTGVFPELKLTHLIPKERVAESYLVKLREGITITHWLLQYKWLGVSPRNPLSPLSLLALLKNIVVRRGVHRRMYLAEKRAILIARRIISASQTKT